MEACGAGGYCQAPGKGSWQTGVGTFGKVAESEKGPNEGSAGGPSVECVEEREMVQAEIDRCRNDREEDTGSVERRHHEEEDRVGEEIVEVGCDQDEPGECEGGEEGEEAGIP